MPHVPEGVLRRLLDEPVAVADRHVAHLARCARCSQRRDAVAADAAESAALLAAPPLYSDAELAFARRDRFELARRETRVPRRPHWRLMWPSLSSGATIAAVAVLAAGVAAATTLTTVFAPTTVTPLKVSAGELGSVATLLGFTQPEQAEGFSSPNGTKSFSFGTLTWSSAGAPQQVSSLSAAEAASGLDVTLPSVLPSGVGAPNHYVAMRTVTATFTFTASAGAALSGSTLNLTVGPGIGVVYGGSGGPASATMAVVSITRPLVTSTGANTSDLENFLLSRPGLPPALAEELKLVGNPGSSLPVPVPAGADSSSVTIDGAPGVLLSDPTNAVSAAVWEDAKGQVHLVGGLLDGQDTLNVANQVG